MSFRWLAAAGLVALLSPAAAAADDPPAASTSATTPRRGDVGLSFAGGAVVHYMFEYPDASLAWNAGVRLGLHRHLAFEAEVGRWSYGSRVTPSPGGPPDDNPLVYSDWETSSWNVGANLVARTAGRKLSVWGGGGVGLYRLASSSSYRLQDGSGQSFSGARNRLGVQFVGGVDAAVARHWRAFAGLRVEVPYPQDFGSALPVFLGGVRMVF